MKPKVPTKAPVHKAPATKHPVHKPVPKPVQKPHVKPPTAKDSILLEMYLKLVNGVYGKQNVKVQQSVEINEE